MMLVWCGGRRQIKASQHREALAAQICFFVTVQQCRWHELYRLLQLRPWDVNPLDVRAGEPCPWPPGSGGHTGWPKALALREELEKSAD